MTANAILEKLRLALSELVDSECKVVYILAESRKLLSEYSEQRDSVPFALNLYCNWALHVDLDRNGTTLEFLERVDQYISSAIDGNKDLAAERALNKEFLFLTTFRQEFNEFLNWYGLPTTLTDEDSRWHGFLQHYAGVIEDGSLSCKADKANVALRHVRKIVFTKGRTADSRDQHVPFNLKWTIFLTDMRELTVELTGLATDPDNYGIVTTWRRDPAFFKESTKST